MSCSKPATEQHRRSSRHFLVPRGQSDRILARFCRLQRSTTDLARYSYSPGKLNQRRILISAEPFSCFPVTAHYSVLRADSFLDRCLERPIFSLEWAIIFLLAATSAAEFSELLRGSCTVVASMQYATSMPQWMHVSLWTNPGSAWF